MLVCLYFTAISHGLAPFLFRTPSFTVAQIVYQVTTPAELIDKYQNDLPASPFIILDTVED